MIKTILWQIIAQCAGTQDIIKILLLYDPYGRKSGLKTVAFLLRLSIYCPTCALGFCWCYMLLQLCVGVLCVF